MGNKKSRLNFPNISEKKYYEELYNLRFSNSMNIVKEFPKELLNIILEYILFFPDHYQECYGQMLSVDGEHSVYNQEYSRKDPDYIENKNNSRISIGSRGNI